MGGGILINYLKWPKIPRLVNEKFYDIFSDTSVNVTKEEKMQVLLFSSNLGSK